MGGQIHKSILDSTVAPLEALAAQLHGAAVLVTGASGFLAASLLVFLDTIRRRHGIRLDLAASARRAAKDVPLFDFAGTSAPAAWQIASVEDTLLPDGRKWIVVHTASFGAPADYMREPIATYEANTRGISQLFERACSKNCERIVYFSTAEVYGQPPENCIPTSEDFNGGPDLSDARSIYGESKRMAEVLGVTLSRMKNIPFTVLRPWNVYGPGQRWNDGRVPVEFFRQLREKTIIKLLSDGSPRRSFCHVWEAMPQIAYCLRHPDAPGRAFNIGRQGDEVSILELAKACASADGFDATEAVSWSPDNRAPGMVRCQPDTSRISALLGQNARSVPLPEGLDTVREWIDFLAKRS